MRFKIIFFGLVFERILVLSISCSFCIKNKNGPFGFILFTSRQLKSILFMWSWSCFHFGFCCDTWSHGNCARKCFFFSSTIQQTTTIESFSRCLSRLKENMRKWRMRCHAISLVSNWSKNLNNPSSLDLHAPCFYSVPFDSRQLKSSDLKHQRSQMLFKSMVGIKTILRFFFFFFRVDSKEHVETQPLRQISQITRRVCRCHLLSFFLSFFFFLSLSHSQRKT